MTRRYLLDENLQTPKDIFDAKYINMRDILPLGTPDRTVLKYAREFGLVIITKDIKMALNAIIQDQPVVFIDPNGNHHYLEKAKPEIITENYNIRVNAKPIKWNKSTISYEEVVDLSGIKRKGLHTIMWSLRNNQGTGTLIPNKDISVKEGMVFVSMITDNA